MPSKKKGYVFYHDVEVTADWPEKIRKAQEMTHYEIASQVYRRIPYGQERPRWSTEVACHDCAVIPGQLHVPGCDVEQCPACGGQAIACSCED